MITDELTIRFTSPAFLGGADQSAEWRVPPFKALLRQAWRMVRFGQGDNLERIRQAEGELFGHAALKHGKRSWASRSRVSLQLNSWTAGTMKDWPRLQTVKHPEVDRPRNGMIDVGEYLAYGPVRRGERRAAIGPGEHAVLTVRYDIPRRDDLRAAMAIMDAIGTIGGRSRNGWGSFALQGNGFALASPVDALRRVARPIRECLQVDWPHAVGTDERGLLLWETGTASDWKAVVKTLAEIKIAVRTSVDVGAGFSDRHLLGYPVTNHVVRKWGKDTRLAGQLRFKIVDSSRGLLARIVHVPSALPSGLAQKLRQPPNREQQLEVWRQVHRFLDDRLGLQRVC